MFKSYLNDPISNLTNGESVCKYRTIVENLSKLFKYKHIQIKGIASTDLIISMLCSKGMIENKSKTLCARDDKGAVVAFIEADHSLKEYTIDFYIDGEYELDLSDIPGQGDEVDLSDISNLKTIHLKSIHERFGIEKAPYVLAVGGEAAEAFDTMHSINPHKAMNVKILPLGMGFLVRDSSRISRHPYSIISRFHAYRIDPELTPQQIDEALVEFISSEGFTEVFFNNEITGSDKEELFNIKDGKLIPKPKVEETIPQEKEVVSETPTNPEPIIQEQVVTPVKRSWLSRLGFSKTNKGD